MFASTGVYDHVFSLSFGSFKLQVVCFGRQRWGRDNDNPQGTWYFRYDEYCDEHTRMGTSRWNDCILFLFLFLVDV